MYGNNRTGKEEKCSGKKVIGDKICGMKGPRPIEFASRKIALQDGVGGGVYKMLHSTVTQVGGIRFVTHVFGKGENGEKSITYFVHSPLATFLKILQLTWYIFGTYKL